MKTQNENSNGGTFLARFERYGLPGLVIGVLFGFVWFNMNTTNKVIERHTEAIMEMKGVTSSLRDALNNNAYAVQSMKDALKDNTSAVNLLREDRRSRAR